MRVAVAVERLMEALLALAAQAAAVLVPTQAPQQRVALRPIAAVAAVVVGDLVAYPPAMLGQVPAAPSSWYSTERH